MTSFSRFLGASPTIFKLDLEFVPISHEGSVEKQKEAAVEVDWSESDSRESLIAKLKKAFVDYHTSPLCEQCELEFKILEENVHVWIHIKTKMPVLRSLSFFRQSGNSTCDELFLWKTLPELDLSTVSHISCHEGFPFFVPGIIPTEQWQSLVHLNFASAGLMAIPNKIGKFELLKELRLSNNKLTSLPRELGCLKHLEVLIADRNQIVSIPSELCDCCNLHVLNLEFNNLTAVVLDLSKFPKLHSLQLYANPLSYFPELSVCDELRSLSLMNLRVWSDMSFNQFEVTIEGTTNLDNGTKLGPLFSMIFSRSSSQHPLLAGALGRLSEFSVNCDAILEQPRAPLKQLILMALSPHTVVQEQAVKVIGRMINKTKTAETLVKNGVLNAMLTVLESKRQEAKIYAMKALSALAMCSDAIAISLLVPKLTERLTTFVKPSFDIDVRHQALETIGNFAFATENKAKLLSIAGFKDTLKTLGWGSSTPIDRRSRLLACRCLAILGEHDIVDSMVGRKPIGKRGVRILSIDGGGMKGLSAVKMLQELENRTGQRIYDLFDLIGGTSTGAMLAVAIGIGKLSLKQCSDIYKTLGYRVFNQAHEEDQTGWKESLFRMYRSGQQGLRVVMAGCKHDASTFESLLQETCSSFIDKEIGSLYIDSAVCPGPKVFAAATLTSIAPAVPFIFRNYELPPPKRGSKLKDVRCLGSSKFDLWQGVRASSAAPYFFEDFKLNGLHFQDGALTANNPTGLALQQAKLLWPQKSIDCIVSIGLGAVPSAQREKSSSSFIESGSVLIESCCSVESTHDMMTLLSSFVDLPYFRFRPIDKRCDLGIDDLDPEKWNRLEAATADYIEKNDALFKTVSEILMTRSNPMTPLSEDEQGLFVDKQAGLVVLKSNPPNQDASCCLEGPLHFMDYCAGTIDLSNRQSRQNPTHKTDLSLSSVNIASDLSDGAKGKTYLQRWGEQLSNRIGAFHLDIPSVVGSANLILSWSTSHWSVVDPSPEAASLRSVLKIDSERSLVDALKACGDFEYFGSTCRLLFCQQLCFGSSSMIYVFERTEPKEILRLESFTEWGAFVSNALITSTSPLSDDLIDKFLRAGARAVVSRRKESHIPLHDRVSFFKTFYDSIFSGHEIQGSLNMAASSLPHSKNAFTLFY